MRNSGWVGGAALALCLSSGVWAQEDPPPAEGETPPSAEAPAETTSEESSEETGSRFKRFFGDQFALFVEFGASSSEFEDLDASVQTGLELHSRNRLTIEDVFGGRGTIGWKLPSDRGRYLFTFEGFKEKGFDYEAVGNLLAVPLGGTAQYEVPPLPWWTLRMTDAGLLESVRVPPIWNDDGDNVVEADEISYDPGAPDLSFSTSTPTSLKNRTQTWDLYYHREWGGRRVRGAWTAGGRYFTYEGTIPLAAWLGTSTAVTGSQFTDGALIRLIPLAQDTTGWGPRGSGEVQYNFARGRITLYGQATAALLFQRMNVDSGDFTTFTRDPSVGVTLLAPARLSLSLDKTVWHLIGEAGARIRVVPGGFLVASYSYRGYLDMILIPGEISIPSSAVQVDKGTIGLYTSRDLRIRSLFAGFSYQF